MAAPPESKVNPLLLCAAFIHTRIHAAVQYVRGLAQDGEGEGEGKK